MKKSGRDTLDMTSGSPARILFVFAVPMILSNMFQQLYNIIDSLIVGNYLGADALAAVGSVGVVTAVIVQLASGLALGASVVIAQYFGAGRTEKIRVCMTTMSIFSLGLGLVLTAVTQISAEKILGWIQTPEKAMADSEAYLTIYFWGCAAIFLYNALNAVYIALGDSRTPLYFLILAFFLNVAGDLFFILNCSMGVGGSALATTLSQVLCTFLALAVLERKMGRIGMRKAKRLFDPEEFVRMMKIAVPAALQQSVVSMGNVCVQAVINGFGLTVMAGCSAANKALNLISAVPINWGNALSNYVGQNIGARRPERIRDGVRVSLLATGALSGMMICILELMPERIIRLFVDEEEAVDVIRVGASYLRVTGWFLIVFSVYMVVKSVFKGAGDIGWFVGLTLGSLGIRVLCAFFLTPVFGRPMLWWSVVIGWCVLVVPTVGHYIGGKWKGRGIEQGDQS
ncbi:MAG TPA: MATE family efflux transporter [Lachnospiraceae bacterium]|nr:MATE family efflux transporter [Lachnospiraceae bacterium]